MSMAEALRTLRGKVPWLKRGEDDTVEVSPSPTALEEAECLVMLAKVEGRIDRLSVTWKAVSRWAATELIDAQTGLETATGDKAAALRSRAKTLRDLLAIDDSKPRTVIEEQAPYVP